MSSKLRNPFRMRASEKIESDASFLRIYSPYVLEALQEKDSKGELWNNVTFIRSSPGAGKTSLLRLFEPNSLNTLFNNKSAFHYRELYTTLKKLGVISEDRVDLLGITLICTRNYEILEDLNISKAQKIRLFFSLLNSRIIIAILRGILTLKHKQFPDGLDEITYSFENKDDYFSNLTLPCTGRELYDWAVKIEKNAFSVIDSFLPLSELSAEGHNELFALSVLKPEYFKINDEEICSRFLFMLDDTHKLSPTQRKELKKYVTEHRGTTNIWVAERLEALDPKETIGSYNQRDYQEINLEKFWAERPAKFEKILSSIASKRAGYSTEDVNSFQEYLDDDINETKNYNNFIESIKLSKTNLQKISSFTNKYDNWLKYVEDFNGSTFEKALLYKQLEILMSRSMAKTQLGFDFPHTQQELLDKIKPDIEAAAKLFLSKTVKVPYYFGFSCLAKISSNNIEQFISISSELFESMLSNKISGNPTQLSAEDQERIIRRVIEKKWKDLFKIIPYSTSVINFLSNLGDFSNKETHRPNAPYTPGISGFTIKSNPKLINDVPWINDPSYEILLNVISTCVAYNLLEVKETFQGEKGQKWDVFYLNRWLCIRFNLPLGYGGFRHKNPDELLKWTKK